MSKFKPRDFDYTINDDLTISIQSLLTYKYDAAHPVYSTEGELIGWIIKSIYE